MADLGRDEAVALSAEETGQGPSRTLVASVAALLVLVVALAFQPAFSAQFVSYDDPENLTSNFAFRGLGSENLAWMFTTGRMGHFQPLSWLSFGVDYVLWGRAPEGGLDPFGFHVTNVVLHALAALAVFFLMRALFAACGRGGTRLEVLCAGFAGLVFAVHPLRAESVAWATERRDVLSAPFFLLALLAWVRFGAGASAASLRTSRLALGALASAAALGAFFLGVDRSQVGRLGAGPLGAAGLVLAGVLWSVSLVLCARGSKGSRAGWFALAGAALLLSLGAKAWGIVMPALLLIVDVWPLGRLAGSERRPRAWGRLLLEKAPFLALTVAFGALAKWAQAGQMDTVKTLSDHTLLERVAQGAYGLVFYPLRTLWPRSLAPIYDLPEELPLGSVMFGGALAAVLAITFACFALRRRAPALLAAWVAFGVIASPVLGVLQSGPQLVADRYSYLACIPFACLAAAGLERLVRVRPRGAQLAAGGAVLVAAALLLATRAQVAVWRDSQALWEHAIAVRPDSPMAHLSLGTVRLQAAEGSPDRGRKLALLDEAMALFERGAELEAMPRLYANMALVEGSRAELEPRRAGELRQRALQLSAESLRLARERNALEPELRLNHGVHLMQAGRLAEALEIFQIYVRVRPTDVRGRLRYAYALLQAGRAPEAVPQLQQALRLDPSNQGARMLLQEARARQGG